MNTLRIAFTHFQQIAENQCGILFAKIVGYCLITFCQQAHTLVVVKKNQNECPMLITIFRQFFSLFGNYAQLLALGKSESLSFK